MERSSGAYSLLHLPGLYTAFQRLVGARSAQTWLLHVRWGLRDFKGSVVDIGCGTGTTFEMLADSKYIGFDINAEYIASAMTHFGHRATFLQGGFRDVQSQPSLRDADVVICLGVLHHLDEVEARGVVRFAREILRPGGRFLGIEPTYLIKQDRISRMILHRDRGCNIRFQHQWDALLHREFDRLEANISTGLLRIPYTHYIYEATKEGEPDGRPVG